MAESNARLVRGLYDAFNAGDVETVISAMHPDVVFHELEALPEADVYHGHAGMRRFVAKLADAFEDFRYEVREVVPAGDEVVVVLEASGRGRGSDVPVALSFVSVWTVRDGRLLRHVALAERDEALRAAGIQP